jgi:Flp pilus assembly protein TadD
MRPILAIKLLLPLLLLGTVGCASTGPLPTSQASSDHTTPDYTTKGALEVADKALADGRYRDAGIWFQRALKNDTENTTAKVGLGEVYLGMGAYDEALKAFNALSNSQVDTARIKQGRGIALLALGKREQAYTALSHSVAQDPSKWRAWNALGLYHDYKKEWDKAENAYRMASMAAPNEAAPHNNWGVSLMAQSRYQDAAGHFARAVELEPASKTSETNLRLALAHQGNYAEAMVGVTTEELPRALNNLGYVAMINGETERARAYFVRAINESPTFYEPAAKNLSLLESMAQVNTFE